MVLFSTKLYEKVTPQHELLASTLARFGKSASQREKRSICRRTAIYTHTHTHKRLVTRSIAAVATPPLAFVVVAVAVVVFYEVLL